VHELRLSTSGCDRCSRCDVGTLARFGLNTEGADYLVALAGNPNTGKSTVFNALTGLRQHVGNWPGKTVVRVEGAFRYQDLKFKVVDLPGTYSLLSQSPDEEVARDFLLFGRPDVTVIVVDATALERNLNLVLQVLEITDRVVVALNLMDEAERNGLAVDHRSLSRDLGVPVVPMAARRGQGIQDLLSTMHGVATGRIACSPKRASRLEPGLEDAVGELVRQIEAMYPGIPNARWVSLRLLEGDASLIREVEAGTLGMVVHDAVPEPGVAEAPA
jgi:ferrous iron transport protein B